MPHGIGRKSLHRDFPTCAQRKRDDSVADIPRGLPLGEDGRIACDRHALHRRAGVERDLRGPAVKLPPRRVCRRARALREDHEVPAAQKKVLRLVQQVPRVVIDEKGKISLSIKQAEPKPQGVRRNGAGGRQQGGRGGSDNFDWNRRQNSSDNFDDMLSKFMASSDEKISGLKKDNRRSRKGGNGGANQW